MAWPLSERGQAARLIDESAARQLTAALAIVASRIPALRGRVAVTSEAAGPVRDVLLSRKSLDHPPASDLPRIPHADTLHHGARSDVVPDGTGHHGLHAEDV